MPPSSRLLAAASLVFILSFILSGCATAPSLQNSNTVADGTILLLGEVHDNPDGHQQRFDALQKRVVAGWRPAIAMEQFDRENQSQLSQQLSQAQAECKDADCIISKVGGKRWEWPLYRPVIQLALDYKLPLLAANLSRSDAGKLMREGYAAVLDTATIQAYRLDQPLPAAIIDGQRHAMEAGHCGKMPDDIVPGMVRAQVARDVWMAKVITDHAATGKGVVLLAGNGHVRNDLGVPQWLPANLRGRMQSHGYLEADDNASPSVSASKQYDITHVIQPHVRPDPCKTITAPMQKPVEKT